MNGRLPLISALRSGVRRRRNLATVSVDQLPGASRRRTRRTPDDRWRGRFLKHLRDTGAVRYACEAAGVSRDTAYRHRQQHEAFALAWSDALEDSSDELEAEARRRAKDGSDQLLMFLLKAHRPGVYRDTHRLEHSGGVQVSREELVRKEVDEMTPEQLDVELAGFMEAAGWTPPASVAQDSAIEAPDSP